MGVLGNSARTLVMNARAAVARPAVLYSTSASTT